MGIVGQGCVVAIGGRPIGAVGAGVDLAPELADSLRNGGEPLFQRGQPEFAIRISSRHPDFAMLLQQAKQSSQIPARISCACAETAWGFPHDPFVEYEERDAEWARPLGFGREVTRMSHFSGEGRLVGIEPAGPAALRLRFELSGKTELELAK